MEDKIGHIYERSRKLTETIESYKENVDQIGIKSSNNFEQIIQFFIFNIFSVVFPHAYKM
jgi:hypothetical protein